MELRHLKHFVAVAEELHFARAAERLGMEQSPLSHSIRNLESELRVRLFQRTTRRTWLTRAGTRFYADARRILDDIEESTSALRNEQGEQPYSLRLVMGEDLASEPFTRLLFELEHHARTATVEVREMAHGEAARLVLQGGADVALTLDGRVEEGLEQRRAWAEPLMLVTPFGHPLAERDCVRLGEIASERLALPRRETCPGYLQQVEALFARHKIPMPNRVSVRHWNTAVSFAATGRALALCPTSLVNGATSVAVVSIAEDDAELVTWLLYRDHEAPSVSLVLELAALVESDAGALAARDVATA